MSLCSCNSSLGQQLVPGPELDLQSGAKGSEPSHALLGQRGGSAGRAKGKPRVGLCLLSPSCLAAERQKMKALERRLLKQRLVSLAPRATLLLRSPWRWEPCAAQCVPPGDSRDEGPGEEQAKGPLPQLFTLLGLWHLLFHLSCHTCGMQTLAPSPSASHQMCELTQSDSPGRPPQPWTAPAHPAPSLTNSPAADNILLSCRIFLLQGGVKPEPPKALMVFAQNKAANVSHSLGFLLGVRGLDTSRERQGPKGQEPSPGTRYT